ncbi:MAG: serine/threonine protein kinase [Candidatus Obscuribacterales bacterium]|nr:serine/threonine protein kinase [Candidatus Obscuribacterales bacterium]
MQDQQEASAEDFSGLTSELELQGRYSILSRLGSGGMGEVFLARDLLLDRTVAIKLLLPALAETHENRARFLREAKVLSALRHQHVLKLHSFGVTKRGPYQVSDYLEGRTLGARLKEGGPLKFDEFRVIFLQITDALHHASELGLVHRDVKPGNIFLCASKNSDEMNAVLLDFGIVRDSEEKSQQKATTTITETSAILGSPAYMSPEQCCGAKVDRRADIYSLGCVMYECLSGRPPFVSDHNVSLMLKHMNEEPATIRLQMKNKALKTEICSLIMQCLRKSQSERPSSFAEIHERLRDIEYDASSEAKFVCSNSNIKWGRPEVALGLLFALIVSVVLLVSNVRSKPVSTKTMPSSLSGAGIPARAIQLESEVDRLTHRWTQSVGETKAKLSFEICDRSKKLARMYWENLCQPQNACRILFAAVPYARVADSANQECTELYLDAREVYSSMARAATSSSIRDENYQNAEKMLDLAAEECAKTNNYKLSLQLRLDRAELCLETNRFAESQKALRSALCDINVPDSLLSNINTPDVAGRIADRVEKFCDRYSKAAARVNLNRDQKLQISGCFLDICEAFVSLDRCFRLVAPMRNCKNWLEDCDKNSPTARAYWNRLRTYEDLLDRSLRGTPKAGGNTIVDERYRIMEHIGDGGSGAR